MKATFVAMAILGCWAAVAAAAAPVELLTPAEAAQPNQPVGKENKARVRDGLVTHSETKTPMVLGAPQIIVDTPMQGVGVTAPFPVKIRFVPASGAKIKVDTLKVDVLKLIPISLLSRVRPYLSAAGINVPEAKIPSGTYNVRIVVADDQGREGSTIQLWTVR